MPRLHRSDSASLSGRRSAISAGLSRSQWPQRSTQTRSLTGIVVRVCLIPCDVCLHKRSPGRSASSWIRYPGSASSNSCSTHVTKARCESMEILDRSIECCSSPHFQMRSARCNTLISGSVSAQCITPGSRIRYQFGSDLLKSITSVHFHTARARKLGRQRTKTKRVLVVYAKASEVSAQQRLRN